ncbi:MAG: M20 family peptidase [Spirochaetes bacterium]|nr:M20 family peptidase [Spirochaetota bacterium]
MTGSEHRVRGRERKLTGVDAKGAARRLAGAIRFRTISRQDQSNLARKEFLGLHAFLKKSYPKLHRTLHRETVNDLSLLYTWKGSDPQAEPILLMAHLDVVPVEQGTEPNWTHPPFSGTVAGGFVWGRGALDVKDGVIGIMEAVESLLAAGFAPKRTVYLAFGHDEEVLGGSGAAAVCDLLASRGARLAFVLDEGGFIRTDGMPGVPRPVALVSVAEKGYLTLDLEVRGGGGHSGMPPRRTVAGRLAAALCRLEKRPFPARLTPPVRAMFRALAREAASPYRYVYGNVRLFSPLMLAMLARTPSSDAMIRTTVAPTMLEGSGKENVMPQSVRATVNLRILPGDTRESVTARVKKVVGDPGVVVTARGQSSDPSPISDAGSPEYAALAETIASVFPDVVVAPFLMVAATDSRHFARISRQVFRFNPVRMDSGDLARIHGTDERIGVRNFGDLIAFFAALVRRTAG